jgi:hypothetical protein
MATVKLKNMPDWLKLRLGLKLDKPKKPAEAKIDRTINPEQIHDRNTIDNQNDI